jgi:Methyltransferase domain
VFYLELLRQLHERLKPGVYLEIGIGRGLSLECARPGTRRIGVDPSPKKAIDQELLRSIEFHKMTSDEFFKENSPAYDLALIDGMHLFEFALRDFINLERLAGEGSVILSHDCIPMNEAATSRERATRQWTGDVWKLVPILREMRPDLEVTVAGVEPSGLALVSGLDPQSTVLSDAYEEIHERFLPLEYADAMEFDFQTVTPDVAIARLGDDRAAGLVEPAREGDAEEA